MGALAGVGVSDAAESVYRHLLRSPGAAVSRLATVAGVTRTEAGRLLVSLGDAGLLRRDAGARCGWAPVPPDAAIERAIVTETQQLVERQVALAKARGAIAGLADEFLSGLATTGSRPVVTVVTGERQIWATFQRVQNSVTEELVKFDRGPYLAPVSSANDAEMAALSRGVRWRVIYAQEVLDEEYWPALRGYLAAGEEARVTASLPMKMTIADRRLALLPLTVGDQISAALLVEPCALLDALAELFERVWADALPVAGAGGPDPEWSAEDRELAALMAAGQKDESIARMLGMSPRTVRRRVSELEAALGAVTRYQAGAQAVRRGLLPM